jgi:phage tail tube protein FII
MMTSRVRQMIQATLGGLPVMQKIDDFDPPKIDFDMETMQGGRFIEEEMAKGLKALVAKLTLQGIGLPIMLALGAEGAANVLLQVREAGVDQDDQEFFTYHTIGGKLKVLEEKTVKMKDKPVTVLELAVRTYERRENGVVVIDIDTRTQKLVLNGEDILKGARRLVLMS